MSLHQAKEWRACCSWNKPKGLTSHDVVTQPLRALSDEKIGHAALLTRCYRQCW